VVEDAEYKQSRLEQQGSCWMRCLESVKLYNFELYSGIKINITERDVMTLNTKQSSYIKIRSLLNQI
jgi:hypothetical protein